MGKFLRLIGGLPRQADEGSASAIYDESVTIASPVTTGDDYTLPNSGSYEGEELEIFLDGQVLDSGVDYNFVGSGVKTQVEFTFDLLVGDRLRFRKIRGP